MSVLAIQELVPLLIVEDMDRSLGFYRDRLGFAVVRTWEPDGRIAWCRAERDGVAIMLQEACDEDGPAEGRGRGTALFLHCDDANVEHQRLGKLGLELAPPQVAFYGMNQFFLTDPDGYELCFQNDVQRE